MLLAMRSLAVLLLLSASAARAEVAKPAYTADVVATFSGHTAHSRIASNGVVSRTVSDDGKSITYTDSSLHRMWMSYPTSPCLEVPLPSDANAPSHDEVLGKETIDGHPTTKVKVTTTYNGKTFVETQWRATDLGDLVIRRRAADGSSESHLEHIVIGIPDAKLLAFPSPQCKLDPSLVASVAQPSGGERRISFDKGACKSIVALPISMQIPSDYAIRNADAHGCFWGAEDDLKRVLADPNAADFESIRRGVFWCRVSENTEYDPVRKRFVSEMGDDSQWESALKAGGAKNASIERGIVGAFPLLSMKVTMSGQRAYMLYVGVPDTESLAVLINYHPAGRGDAADEAAWDRFIKSLKTTR